MNTAIDEIATKTVASAKTGGLSGPFTIANVSVPGNITFIGPQEAKDLNTDYYRPLLFVTNGIKRFQQDKSLMCKCGLSDFDFTLSFRERKNDLYVGLDIRCTTCDNHTSVAKNIGHIHSCDCTAWEQRIRDRVLGIQPAKKKGCKKY